MEGTQVKVENLGHAVALDFMCYNFCPLSLALRWGEVQYEKF
jgi:hypothetical protein